MVLQDDRPVGCLTRMQGPAVRVRLDGANSREPTNEPTLLLANSNPAETTNEYTPRQTGRGARSNGVRHLIGSASPTQRILCSLHAPAARPTGFGPDPGGEPTLHTRVENCARGVMAGRSIGTASAHDPDGNNGLLLLRSDYLLPEPDTSLVKSRRLSIVRDPGWNPERGCQPTNAVYCDHARTVTATTVDFLQVAATSCRSVGGAEKMASREERTRRTRAAQGLVDAARPLDNRESTRNAR